MKDVITDPDLVARCGLYCGACKSYLAARCPGCRDNVKATWCKIKSCCAERGIATCASCETHLDPAECRTFNNLIGRVIGVVLNSDRRACVLAIRKVGREEFAGFMAGKKRQTLPRWGI